MTRPVEPDAVQRDAAAWLARLSRPVVSQDELARFRIWRREPAHDRAFLDLQALVRQTGALADDPDILAALESASRPRPKVSKPILALGAAIGGLSTAAVALGGLLVLWAPGTQTYATQVGERSVIHLADGSTVQLDTDSRLRVALRAHDRQLRLLRGQALFEVAHDRSRPFTVSAGAMQVTATGTRFDVRQDLASGPKVILLDGSVRVRTGGHENGRTWTLSPGQELSTTLPRPRQLPAAEEAATAWTGGRLTFRGVPLADVLAEANRYSRIRLAIVESPKLDTIRVEGVFTAGDSAGLAQALSDLYSLRSETAADGSITLSAQR